MSQELPSPVMGEPLSRIATVSSVKTNSSGTVTGLSSCPDEDTHEHSEGQADEEANVDSNDEYDSGFDGDPDKDFPGFPPRQTLVRRPVRLAICDKSDLSNHPLPVVNLLYALEADILTNLRIHLLSDTNSFPPLDLGVHKPMIKSSLPLVHLASLRQSSIGGVHLRAGGRFTMEGAFEAAVQNVYGLRIIDVEVFDSLVKKGLGWEGCDIPIDSVRNKRAIMTFAICYTVSGAFLEIQEIVDAGMKLIQAAINWDTLEMALDFGLRPEEFLITVDEVKSADQNAKSKESVSDKNEEITSPSNDESSSKANEQPSSETKDKVPLTYKLNTELVEKCAPEVMRNALKWMVAHLPSTFIFDRMAQVKKMPDRIPAELRTTVPSPFVQEAHTLLSDTCPDPQCSCASAILVSLPLKWLQVAFEIINQQRVVLEALVHAILREREYRRIQALIIYCRTPEEEESNADGSVIICDLASSLSILLELERAHGGGPGPGPGSERKTLGLFLHETPELGYREYVEVHKRRTFGDVVEVLEEFELQHEWVGTASIYAAQHSTNKAVKNGAKERVYDQDGNEVGRT